MCPGTGSDLGDYPHGMLGVMGRAGPRVSRQVPACGEGPGFLGRPSQAKRDPPPSALQVPGAAAGTPELPFQPQPLSLASLPGREGKTPTNWIVGPWGSPSFPGLSSSIIKGGTVLIQVHS